MNILKLRKQQLQFCLTIFLHKMTGLTAVSNRIVRAFNRSGATQTTALDISKALDKDWHADLFTNLSLTEFLVKYLALFCIFSVIESCEWFLMGSLSKNIQLMLVFLKAPILVLHFCFYTLITFLKMLSVMLLSNADDTTLYFKCEKVHLICGNN